MSLKIACFGKNNSNVKLFKSFTQLKLMLIYFLFAGKNGVTYLMLSVTV